LGDPQGTSGFCGSPTTLGRSPNSTMERFLKPVPKIPRWEPLSPSASPEREFSAREFSARLRSAVMEGVSTKTKEVQWRDQMTTLEDRTLKARQEFKVAPEPLGRYERHRDAMAAKAWAKACVSTIGPRAPAADFPLIPVTRALLKPGLRVLHQELGEGEVHQHRTGEQGCEAEVRFSDRVQIVPISELQFPQGPPLGSVVTLADHAKAHASLRHGEMGHVIKDDGTRVSPIKVKGPRGVAIWNVPDLVVQEPFQDDSAKKAVELMKSWQTNARVVKQLCHSLAQVARRPGIEGMQSPRGMLVSAGAIPMVVAMAENFATRYEIQQSILSFLGALSIDDLQKVVTELSSMDATAIAGLDAVRELCDHDVDQVALYGGRELCSVITEAHPDNAHVQTMAVAVQRRLKRSHRQSLLKQQAVASVHDELFEQYKKNFDALDDDGTGSLDAEELRQLFMEMGLKVTLDEVKEWIKEVDVDGGGTVEFGEFCWLMSKFGDSKSVESLFTDQQLAELRQAFEVFDADGGGDIDIKELGQVMESLGIRTTKKELQEMIREVDADNSGTVDFHEFLGLMNKKGSSDENLAAWRVFDPEGDEDTYIEVETFINKVLKLDKKGEIKKKDLEGAIVECKFEDNDYSTITYKEFVKLLMKQ